MGIWDRSKKMVIKKVFDRTVKNVLDTPPISYRQDDSVTIVSMVSSDTVQMYLLAIKSFMRSFGYGTIEAINDGSLTEQDKEVLRQHIPGIHISYAPDVETYDGPSYISWKRLYRVVELAKTSYVIQLDSDTVTQRPLVNVNHCVKHNLGFVTGCNTWQNGVDLPYLRDVVKQWGHSHVQPSAEEIFAEIDFLKGDVNYLRGCAGFAGYPKQFASVEDVREMSHQIEAHLGKKWHGWGSEQTATLALISRCKGSQMLPWPTYQNYRFPKADDSIDSAALVHFIGTSRYSTTAYIRLADKLIKAVS